MRWLGSKWEDVSKELAEENIDFTYEITYPTGKVIPSGDLRVARVSRIEGKLIFILIHDRFNK